MSEKIEDGGPVFTAATVCAAIDMLREQFSVGMDEDDDRDSWAAELEDSGFTDLAIAYRNWAFGEDALPSSSSAERARIALEALTEARDELQTVARELLESACVYRPGDGYDRDTADREDLEEIERVEAIVAKAEFAIRSLKQQENGDNG